MSMTVPASRNKILANRSDKLLKSHQKEDANKDNNQTDSLQQQQQKETEQHEDKTSTEITSTSGYLLSTDTRISVLNYKTSTIKLLFTKSGFFSSNFFQISLKLRSFN
jgi:uncharacterized protein YaaR (DUF327 family)